MTLNIYIKYDNDKKSVRLPVLPSEFEMSATQGNTSVTLHGFGEVNLKGDRGLYSISLSSFFPAEYYDFCKCKPKEPKEYIRIFKKLFEDNETVHLIITTTPANIYCTISDFAYSKNDGTGDINYTMKFTEYRENKIKKQSKYGTAKLYSADTVSRVNKKVKTHSYKWKKGDTWLKVSRKETGTANYTNTLRIQNKKVIEKAKKAYIKKHKVKTVKDSVALVGYKVVIKT